jgi:hypothetical protein
VVAQDVSGRLGHAGERPGTVSRLLWIDERGQVVEELVRDADWFRSPLSTRVMRYVIPHDLGYRSNVMSFGWTPPIPQVTAGLCFIGAAMLLRGRRRAGAHG